MSPRKPTAKSIRAAVEKHTPKAAPAPKKAPSIVIQDACAAKGCVNPPAKGGFCEEHLVQAQLAQLIQETSLPAKAHAAIKATAEKVAVKVRPDLAKVSKAEVVAAKEAVQKLAKAPRKDPKKAPPKLDHAARKAAAIHETKAVMATLLKAGWTEERIAEAMGSTLACPKRWTKGVSACKEMPELKALLGKSVPHPSNRDRAPVTGALRVASSSPRVQAPRLHDPRQLVLALEDLYQALGTVLSHGKA